MIELTSRPPADAARHIKIIGIGGAGANALDRLALDGVAPASLVAANTEAQALVASVAGEKIQLGASATRGLGSGGDPELGRCAAEESAAELRSAVEGSEAVFLLAGLGGGTGSGAAPLIAELAREAGALVIAIVTLPFGFEGKRRAAQAAEALAELQHHADAVVCFENDRMGDAVPPRSGIQTAFAASDQTLSQSVLALAALLNRTGLIHLGLDDLAAVLQDVNAHCLFGYGEADGSNRSFDALARALKNPLMDKGRLLRDCETVLVQVSGGADLTLDEVQLLMEEFNRHVNDHTRILFGAAVDPALEGRVTVTILSSIGDAQPAAVRPVAARPERAIPVAPRPAPVQAIPEPEEAEEAEPEPAAEAEEESLPEEVESEIEAPVAEEAVEPEPEEPEELIEAASEFEPEEEPEGATPEAPVAESIPPVAPRPEKPRGLRTMAMQTSLFGDEPGTPIERVAPPVPGRMLRHPFPRKPAPVAPPPAPAPEPEPVVAAPEPVVISEPEPVPETEATPEPAPIPEPKAEPKAATRPLIRRIERRPMPVPQRAPELIPAEEPPVVAGAAAKAPQQEVMQFEPVTRGRFEKSEPTIVDGQDLDVPTYLRRRLKLR